MSRCAAVHNIEPTRIELYSSRKGGFDPVQLARRSALRDRSDGMTHYRQHYRDWNPSKMPHGPPAQLVGDSDSVSTSAHPMPRRVVASFVLDRSLNCLLTLWGINIIIYPSSRP